MTSIARLRVLMLATCVAAGLGPIVHTQSTTIVAVSGGSVRGVVQDGVASWKGIPFAAPPLGQLRWRAPQPVRPWTGVRDAPEYQHDCMQLPFPSRSARRLLKTACT